MVSNREFLATIFGEDIERAWVTGFTKDPYEARGGDWSGTQFGDGGEDLLTEDANTFFSISTFQNVHGKVARRVTNHLLTYVIMIDDIGTGQGAKISPDILKTRFGLKPSYVISTSKDNEQWGLILTSPIAEAWKIEQLQAGMIRAGIADTGGVDAGMRSVTRYGRLPVGLNNKKKYGTPYPHKLVTWDPDTRYSIDELARIFNTRFIEPQSRDMNSTDATLGEDYILEAMVSEGLVKHEKSDKPGVYEITCPWVHEHTDGADNGTAYFSVGTIEGDDIIARGGFSCHHGHCMDRTIRDVADDLYKRGYYQVMQQVTGLHLKRNVKQNTSFADLDTDISREGVEGGAPPGGLETVQASTFDMSNIPERQWLVKDWLPLGQTTALYADGGIGKSLVAQQLATAVVAGVEWFGIEIDNHGPVLGLFCEDSIEELHYRQSGINRAMRVNNMSLDDFFMISRLGEDNLLMTFHDDVGYLTQFWLDLRNTVERIRPRLLIVDTAADTFGGNENIRPQVRQFIQQALTQIASEFDCAVLLLAHPSASGMASGRGGGGSTAWNNTVRSRLYMEREDSGDGMVRLSRKKSNYSAVDEDGVLIKWINGAFQKADAQAIIESAKAKAVQRDFLLLIEAFSRTGRKVSDSKRGNYAPREFYEETKTSKPNISKSDYETAMRALFHKGLICVKGDKKRGQWIEKANT